MPIEHRQGATIITGDSTDFFRLAQLKGAVGLELRGLKMTRGPVIWKQVAREFGIKGNKQAVYDWLCDEVARLRPLQEHRTVENGREVREVEGKEVN